jgi:hypothetical protein
MGADRRRRRGSHFEPEDAQPEEEHHYEDGRPTDPKPARKRSAERGDDGGGPHVVVAEGATVVRISASRNATATRRRSSLPTSNCLPGNVRTRRRSCT